MTVKNNNLSLNQLCVILLGMFISMRPILENSILAKYTGNDCIIVSIIAGIINLCLALIICYVMKKNPGKSFYEIMVNFMGKITTKIIMLGLLFVFIFKLLIIDFQMDFLLYDAIYSDIDWFLFAIPLFLLLAFLAIKGIKVIARCYQVFIPFGLLILFVIFYISFENANFENVLPLFDHTVTDFTKGLIQILLQSSEFIFLFTFMENVVTSDKHYYLKTITILICIFIIIIIFYILFVAVLGNLAPFVQESLIRMTQFKDNSFGYFKIDIFATLFYIPIIILQFSLCIYAIGYCINKVFNFNQNITNVITVICLFAVKFIPGINNKSITNLFFDKMGIYVLAFILLLPIILLLASFKKEKSK